MIEKAIDFAKNNRVPLNSTEGFVRQILVREFIREFMKLKAQKKEQKFLELLVKFNPFYDGTTGIQPIDDNQKNNGNRICTYRTFDDFRKFYAV